MVYSLTFTLGIVTAKHLHPTGCPNCWNPRRIHAPPAGWDPACLFANWLNCPKFPQLPAGKLLFFPHKVPLKPVLILTAHRRQHIHWLSPQGINSFKNDEILSSSANYELYYNAKLHNAEMYILVNI